MTTINSSGNFEATQGVVWDLTVEGNGSSTPVEVDFDPAIGDGLTTDINIGSMTINGGAVVNMYTNVNNISISSITINGGTLVIDPAIVDGATSAGLSIKVGSAGGKILIAQTADPSATIPIVFENGIPGGFVSGFIGATSVTAQYDPATGGTILTANDGRTVIGAGNPYNLPANGDTKTYTNVGPDGVILACFLAGSMIATPGGDTAIEFLSVGDFVLANVDGHWVARKIRALKTAEVHVKGVPSDLSGHPVRICQGALAPSVPDRDLFVTPEHCFLLDGKFVPVRMLVNGITIHYEENIVSYTHYHIETEVHSIIRANNMETESYLDTRSRVSVSEYGHNVIGLRSRVLTWDRDAAAPLETSRSFVEVVYRNICARIPHVVHAQNAAPQPTGLWLDVEGLGKIMPHRQESGRAVFFVPGGVHELYLCSSSARPCDVIGPYVDDRRHLGACVEAVHVFAQEAAQQKTLRPNELNGAGWLAGEADSGRWTDGRALLSIGADISEGPYVLSVDSHTILGNSAEIACNAA